MFEEEINRLRKELDYTKKRLREEVKWGHRKCTLGNCVSSGTDCPAQLPNVELMGFTHDDISTSHPMRG